MIFFIHFNLTNNYIKIILEYSTRYYIKSPRHPTLPFVQNSFSSIDQLLIHVYTKSKINFVIPPCLSCYLVTLTFPSDTALLSSLLYLPALLPLLRSVECFSSPAMFDISKFTFRRSICPQPLRFYRISCDISLISIS